MKSNPIPFIAALLLLSFSVSAQDDSRYKLSLNSGAFIPEKNITTDKITQYNRTASKASGKSFAVIQFENIPTEAEKKQLQAAGIDLLEYIPNNAYTVTITGSLNADVLAKMKARSVIELSAVQKMQPDLAIGNFPAWAVRTTGTINVWISFPKSFTYENVMQELKGRNFDIKSADYKNYRILSLQIATIRLTELASLPFVEFVQAVPHEDQTLNSYSMALSQANVLKMPLALGGRALDGEGVVVGIGDNGNAQNHLDFIGRQISRSAEISRAHATHVTGTIGGAGLLQERYAGYAPKATLLNQTSSNIIAFAPTYVKDYGMVITNNSYGSVVNDCDFNGYYDLTSRIIDQQAFDLPELQNVFAAGNDGFRTCSAYPLGFKTVLGGFQCSKNALTVGSTNYKGDLSVFSSKGPVKDGRIKPEIMSQGENVFSTWDGWTYAANNGTSMATPGVSGGLALLVQRFRQLHPGMNPKSGLLKALICNGGTDRGINGPDFSYGFGSMNLLRSVTMMENATYINDSIAPSATKNHSITIPSNTASLKVTLYWQDPPANLLATKKLVNDLDLTVTTPAPVTTLLPRILNPSSTGVELMAGTGADHLNNIEQIVIDNPDAGIYSLNVNGTLISQNPLQEYFLVYDIIPESLVLTNPVGGEAITPTFSPSDSIHVQWESYGGSPSLFTLEYSATGIAPWLPLGPGSNTISADSRMYTWAVPNIASELTRIKITKNNTGETKISSPFTVMFEPIVSLSSVQCPGYINIYWTAIPGATDYEVMTLYGNEYVHEENTTALNYTFTGLENRYYVVTVRPRINGFPGRKGQGIIYLANSGTCTGSISDNDLKADAIISPASSGRKFTATELTNNIPVTIRIKNLDDAVSTADIVVTYSINGGTPVTETINAVSTPTSTIAAGGTIDYTFATPADLSAAGTYSIEVTATKISDPIVANNKIINVFKQLDNQPITIANLPWLDNLETTSEQDITGRQMGITGSDRYDFVNSITGGRLRTFINSGIAYSGSKALTLDASAYLASPNIDSLTSTFNLATLNANTKDIRLDFQYKNHGQQSDAANKVWIRANDTAPWRLAYDLDLNQNAPGSYKKSESIELSNILKANSENFSSSFQVRWGQKGNTQAVDDYNGAGYTFDDIRLYEVVNDAQMLAIDAPSGYNCALSATTTIAVVIKNSNSTPITNIPVKYRINGGSFITPEIITATIPANTTVLYDFVTKADLSAPGTYTIDAVVNYGGDTFAENDTASSTVSNLPVINTFPYLQNFELDNGSWYTDGIRGSWEYGTVNSPKINRAASGSKVWKTNMYGYYNDFEYSYLYSPCFNISAMTNPMLSFSVSMDIEDCGTAGLCDAAWVEYSSDGITWTKLGSNGSGTNWYNKNYAGNQLWSQQDYIRWHVASNPLPTTGNSQLRLRFVFKSDEGLNKDGIAIDDIHVFDNVNGIYDVVGASPVVNQPVVSGTGWINFIEPGTNKLIASINPNGQNLGSTNVQSFINTSGVRSKTNQYYHDRNITIKPANVNLADSAAVRFYFLDTESEALINATGCATCNKPSTAYDLGVEKYSDAIDANENGAIADNIGGDWLFINSIKATKVPFDKGYYAEFKVKDFSEFWLSYGPFDNMSTLPVELITFTAKKKLNSTDVLIEWKTAAELNINRFEVEVVKGNIAYQQNQFVKIGEVSSLGNAAQGHNYSLTDAESDKAGVRYYRLKIIDNDGSIKYSAIRSLVFDNDIKWTINPNPSHGLFSITFQAADGTQVTAKLFDANGRMVKLYQPISTGFVQKMNINIEEPKYATGMYLLDLEANGKHQSFKLIKQ